MTKLLTRAVVFGAVLCFVSAAYAQSDVTAPGNTIVGLHNTIAGGPNTVSTPGFGAGQFPPGEAPPNAINNALAKYLNFGNGGNSATAGANTGFYVTPALPSIVTGLRFTTANDAPGRDPLTFTLEGTSGDPASAMWTLISSGNTGLQTDPGRNTLQSLATAPVFVNTNTYSSYRLLFPTHRAVENSMQIAEVEFLGVAIPEPSTFALAGAGLLGLIVALRRRRRS
jgi:hypothetical protein